MTRGVWLRAALLRVVGDAKSALIGRCLVVALPTLEVLLEGFLPVGGISASLPSLQQQCQVVVRSSVGLKAGIHGLTLTRRAKVPPWAHQAADLGAR